MCFIHLKYRIKNVYSFLNYIDRRLSQDESELIKDAVIHCERENERPIKDMNHFDWEAEFCVVLAKEVKAMKL